MPYVKAEERRVQLVAAAQQTLVEHGVAGTSLREVARTAGVPLATLQYVFPSKELLLRAVIDDVATQISDVFAAVGPIDDGLEHAIRSGLSAFWAALVVGSPGHQLMQLELTAYALRTAGHAELARVQYERYTTTVAAWCRAAAERAGETPRVDLDQLARLLVAGIDGLIVQHACDPDDARVAADLEAFADLVVARL